MESGQKPIGPLPVAYNGSEEPEPEPKPEEPFTFDPKDPDHQRLAKRIGMAKIRAIERAARLPTDLQRGPFSRGTVKTSIQPKSCFETREARAAQKYATPLPYFRLEDSLCKAFLELAADPSEFEGLKLLFPFVREMSLLGFARTKDKLAMWMRVAFMAGHDLGRAHPDSLEFVLPGLELKEAVRRVGVLQQCSGEEHLTWEGLRRACAQIVRAQWAEVPENQLEPVLLQAVLKNLRVGFAAATVAPTDPVLCEFVCDIPERISDGITDIVSRVLVGAPRSTIGKPVRELLEHPLLRLAREYYPGKKVELDAALGFFRERLRSLGVKSENQCPASELDLAHWVTEALKYGRLLTANQPAVVAGIFKELTDNELRSTLNMLREVVTEVGGTEPQQLIPRLKRWQQTVFSWVEPECYGEELARVVYFSDYAIWISFALSAKGPQP